MEASEEDVRAGELPVGAVVVTGKEVIGRAYIQERAQGRRLVHADLLAMEQADRRLGWTVRVRPLILAVTLEPRLTAVLPAATRGRWLPSTRVRRAVPALRHDCFGRVAAPVRRKHGGPRMRCRPAVDQSTGCRVDGTAPLAGRPPGEPDSIIHIM
ncbi:Cytidine and deoxycytidylate deaminase zinc-binding region [Micromonospora echinospora]|uniref:Cytidine and deoxycytidylate deaminase zinc-binding region n=1 Tax=Micromonospora echinospora TaxID=1877 RepID=A0A1C4ZGC3_MICEC|nr:Cytidine and deoxycytidylate deaminase zinc-binding region [Micromonospora echinospora]